MNIFILNQKTTPCVSPDWRGSNWDQLSSPLTLTAVAQDLFCFLNKRPSSRRCTWSKLELLLEAFWLSGMFCLVTRSRALSLRETLFPAVPWADFLRMLLGLPAAIEGEEDEASISEMSSYLLWLWSKVNDSMSYLPNVFAAVVSSCCLPKILSCGDALLFISMFHANTPIVDK